MNTKPWLEHYASWTPRELDYDERTLVDNFTAAVQAHPNAIATSFFARTRTYAEINTQVRSAAAGLQALGVGYGDRVVLALPNCPQAVVAYHAVLFLGATVVAHNPQYTAAELAVPCCNHGARVAIVWDKAASTFVELREQTNLETIISVNLLAELPRIQRLALRLPIPALQRKRAALSQPAANCLDWEMLLSDAVGGAGKELQPPAALDTHTIAVILYTSGTTGEPKGAQLSHGNLMANLAQAHAWVPGLYEGQQKVLCALPFFHAYGLVGLHIGISVGAELILLPAPQLPLLMQAIIKRKPTFFPGVPTLYQRILEEAQRREQSLESIRNSFSGAATLPADLVSKWQRYTGGVLVEGYGLTETSPVIVGNPMDGRRKDGCVGIPFPDTEVRIANLEDLSQSQPAGVDGEVLVRGPQVFQGYLDKPAATQAAFYDGWLRTGDIGVMDEQGYIRLVSRLKEMIITGGFNVYPAEVEAVLCKHPDIAEAAVVGIPRSDGSESVVAAITLVAGAKVDPAGLQEYCRKFLTRYKVPRNFYHFEVLPKDQLGKIRRREISALLAGASSLDAAVTNASE